MLAYKYRKILKSYAIYTYYIGRLGGINNYYVQHIFVNLKLNNARTIYIPITLLINYQW